MRRDGNGSEAMALGGGRGGDALEQRKERRRRGTETETPTPQTKAEPLPATRSLPSSLWPRWLSRFIPQVRATNTHANANTCAVRSRVCAGVRVCFL